MKVNHNSYHKLTTKKNIFRGFKEFLKGKRRKQDVINFSQNIGENLENLHRELVSKTYLPGKYSQFIVRDPKTRIIHKADVVDRIVHHIVSDVLEDSYDSTFIYHSYACRKNKGTHKAVLALQKMGIRESKNNSKVCWVLKCDISKFFASVNHKTLLEILSRRIKDQDFLEVLEKIINSFSSDKTIDLNNKKGIPIGNLTSQLFSNIYLNELDQFVKHTLKVKFYLRYADDFAFVSYDREYLLGLISPLQKFLKNTLDLDLHPKKIILRKFSSGVDFLGYIIFPKYILPRTKTKRRLIRKIHEKVKQFKAGEISEEPLNQTIQSYYGFLVHANTYEFKQKLQNLIMFWLTE
jgi:RNA-directed DNA polymerase